MSATNTNVENLFLLLFSSSLLYSRRLIFTIYWFKERNHISPPKVDLTRWGNSSPGNHTAVISLLIMASVVSWFASFSSCFSMPSKLVQAERGFLLLLCGFVFFFSLVPVEPWNGCYRRKRLGDTVMLIQFKSDHQGWIYERTWGDRFFFCTQNNMFLHS